MLDFVSIRYNLVELAVDAASLLAYLLVLWKYGILGRGKSDLSLTWDHLSWGGFDQLVFNAC